MKGCGLRFDLTVCGQRGDGGTLLCRDCAAEKVELMRKVVDELRGVQRIIESRERRELGENPFPVTLKDK